MKTSRRRFLQNSSGFAAGMMMDSIAATVVSPITSGAATPTSSGPISPADLPRITDWNLSHGTTWQRVGGRSGGPFIRSHSQIWKKVAISKPFALAPRTSYRLDGWVRAPEGRVLIGADFLDKEGQPLHKCQAPMVANREAWTYIAVEAASSGSSVRGRAWICVEGTGEVDEFNVSPSSPLFFANGDFEVPSDKRGGISYWLPDKRDLTSGKQGGEAQLDGENPYRGKKSLKITCTADWYAMKSLDYPVWPWSDRWQGRCWMQCKPGSTAELLVVWSTANGENLVRVDKGPETSSENWVELLTQPLEPPPGATAVSIILMVKRGTAWFDAALLSILPAKEHVLKVLVNQVGYERKGPKSAVIATNFFPNDGITASVQLNDHQGNTLQELQANCGGRIYGQHHADWGWYFWRTDFSLFDRDEGHCTLKATVGDASGTSFPFAVGDDVVFRNTASFDVDFFFVQRCGFDIPGWHPACHMDDARVNDKPTDLTGGWHSAGDYNKLSWEYGDGAVMYSLAQAARSAPDFFSKFDRDHDGRCDVLDEAEWGARFESKVQVPETGGLLGDIYQGPTRKVYFNWVPPEKQTDGTPGTPDDPVVGPGGGNTPLAIAGWAVTAGLVKSSTLRQEYLSRAEKLLQYYRGKPSGQELIHQQNPHVLIGAIELYRATKKDEYLTFAREAVSSILQQGGLVKGGYNESGDVPCAALAIFALAFPKDPLSKQIADRLRQQIECFVAEPQNPFGVTHQKFGKDGFFFEPTSVYGENFIFSSRAWAALLIYRLTDDRRAWNYAADQMDWIMGKNPYNLCMMVGVGSFNPPRLHTRMNSIPGHEDGLIPGAIPNGFVRDVGGYDRPGFDMSGNGRRAPSYRTNEPWLVQNILHLIATTALHELCSMSVHPPQAG